MILSANRSLLNKKFSRPMAKHRQTRAKAQDEDAAPLLSGTGFTSGLINLVFGSRTISKGLKCL